MTSIANKVVFSLFAALVAAALYEGTYLPYLKSRAAIRANIELREAKTLADVFSIFDRALNAPSPYGQEEVARIIGERVFDAVSVQSDPQAVEQLVRYAEKMFQPLLGSPREISPSQDLLLLGRIHQVAWLKTGDARYAKRGEEIYLRCLEVSPRRPQCLYALFRLYESGGQRERARLVGEEIVRVWPTEGRVREALRAIEKRP